MGYMEKRTFKDSAYSAIADVGKAFSHANRLEIIDLLTNGEKTVEQIAMQTAISVANASQHLQVLKNARLLKSRREGNFIFYSLNGRKAHAAWQALRDLALEQEPALRVVLHQFRQDMGGLESLHLTELPGTGSAVLLDVRPTDEYAAGHWPDALSIPIDALSRRLDELPRDKMIIAYCRGPFCTFADEAVQLLRDNGFDALRLEEGYFDMVLAGHTRQN